MAGSGNALSRVNLRLGLDAAVTATSEVAVSLGVPEVKSSSIMPLTVRSQPLYINSADPMGRSGRAASLILSIFG